mgnify:FL=1
MRTRWTLEAERFLKEHFLSMTQKEMALVLGFTKKAVQHKAERLGLKKSRSLWTRQGYERHPELRQQRAKLFSELGKKIPSEEMARRAALSKGVPKPNGAKTHKRMYEEDLWHPPIFDGKIPRQDTKLELTVKARLDSLGANYVHPFNLHNHFLCDFYLPDYNLIIEADGCYWHGCTQCDLPNKKGAGRTRSRNAYIEAHGYKLLVIPEHDAPTFDSLVLPGTRSL